MKFNNVIPTLIFIYLLISCQNKEIKINRTHLTYSDWYKHGNHILIERMKMSDKNFNINKVKARKNNWDIINNLVIDSNFIYGYDGEKGMDKASEILFNKKNSWQWYHTNYLGKKVDTIGELKKYSWYKFSNLTGNRNYFIYVYVDSVGRVHKFNVDLSNW